MDYIATRLPVVCGPRQAGLKCGGYLGSLKKNLSVGKQAQQETAMYSVQSKDSFYDCRY